MQKTPKYAVLDVESTIYKKGHPFSARNKLCLIGLRVDGKNYTWTIEYDSEPYGDKLSEISRLLDSVDVVVGFNLKFDLNWIRRYGISLKHHRVFDCQLVEFILNNQQPAYPNLDGCLAKYGLGAKLDVVANEYWALGIDTDKVPLEILVHYLEEDLRLTDALYSVLLSKSKDMSGMQSLINLHNQDLLVLQEMETNGIKFNWEGLDQTSQLAEKELNEIDSQLLTYVPQEARAGFNFDSGYHLSALLYGGTIVFKVSHPFESQYKTGPNAGQRVTRNKWEEIRVSFPRLVEPLPKTELLKEGFWQTDEPTLRQLPKPKALLVLLLRRSEIAKWLDTYCKGIPKKREEFDWEDGLVHGQINQCVAITGRLSASNPNQQNFPEALQEFIITRF